ncbi:PD-(D/E)XK nuclease family protein [Alkalimarinus alittae]|uniref:PD-(D/E)XK endonuclease-like domain-containing protein n=1 Tax=Alkalimarinus alittae TaxID=2961619 RepID=A0ABY6N5J1_9ALTE|nr:PD-(D/E)XK nuclease family protein [Alkalimarinus alittae]UZE97249.1 hypothetical protein NKI27_05730 [Alkalimarinus alittae]
MIDALLFGLIAIALLSFIFPLLGKMLSRNKLGIEGKLIWVDKGRKTNPFFNRVFEVLGKPDLMYKIKGGILAVEYKSRKGTNIYQSDIVQAKTAALAARGEGYKVIRILIKTGSKDQYINLPSSDKALFDEVKQYVDITRSAHRGTALKAWPNKFKCRSCAFNHSCSHS